MKPAAQGAVRSAEDTLRGVREHISPSLGMLYAINGMDAVEATGDGALVSLSDGRDAVDFGSYAVTLLGHRHPAVTAAVAAELGRMPTSTRVLANPATAALADRLTGYLDPGRLTRAWFGLNGCDAVEAALKLARAHTGRTRVVAVEGAYHGKSLGALAATWSERYRAPVQSLLGGVTHVPVDVGALDAAFADDDVAAVIFEPVQGEGGVRPLPPEFLHALVARAREAGAFVVADEIQTGLRRCGERSLAVTAGLRPDAVLLGKALGGGVLPLSAMVATEEFHRPLARDPFLHTTTFSGHPLCAAAGAAALEAVEEHAADGADLAERVERGLAELCARHPGLLRGARGRGLLWGLETASPAAAGDLLMELGQRGLLLSPCLGEPEVLRLLPPLVTTPAQLDRAWQVLDEASAKITPGLAVSGSAG
ncbi:aspartate aminotransferase family protein [Streptomyces griseoloalbus]|uniref:aspartate aminotransferase family protein n=1 Tax=Streptomyces griseoloalbus TaxID=67303 RepID=UPI0033B37C0C